MSIRDRDIGSTKVTYPTAAVIEAEMRGQKWLLEWRRPQNHRLAWVRSELNYLTSYYLITCRDKPHPILPSFAKGFSLLPWRPPGRKGTEKSITENLLT